MNKKGISRRNAMGRVASAMAIGIVSTKLPTKNKMEAEAAEISVVGKRINHSACRWCYNDVPMDEFCQAAKKMGVESIDLVGPEDFATLKKYGLTCAMVMSNPKGYGIPKGFNRIEHHDDLVAHYEDLIKKTAEAGMKNVICFSGNRNGLPDEKGIENCAIGLKRLMPTAEKYNVTMTMELLNSKVDHHDYQCDHTTWGVALCKAVGSDRFKLLYDIYHMQIMEGDVIRNIRDYHPYIVHYHTGGVPGRNEIDDTQELYYPAIIRAIIDTGFTGFVAQEFIPLSKDKLNSLKQGVRICDV